MYSQLQTISLQTLNTTTFWNKTCTEVEDFCHNFNLDFHENNFTHCFNITDKGLLPVPLKDVTVRTYASEDFWNREVLGMDVVGTHVGSRWGSWGGVRWPLIGCLAFSWTLICVCMIGGIQSYGKAGFIFEHQFVYLQVDFCVHILKSTRCGSM